MLWQPTSYYDFDELFIIMLCLIMNYENHLFQIVEPDIFNDVVKYDAGLLYENDAWSRGCEKATSF